MKRLVAIDDIVLNIHYTQGDYDTWLSKNKTIVTSNRESVYNIIRQKELLSLLLSSGVKFKYEDDTSGGLLIKVKRRMLYDLINILRGAGVNYSSAPNKMRNYEMLGAEYIVESRPVEDFVFAATNELKNLTVFGRTKKINPSPKHKFIAKNPRCSACEIEAKECLLTTLDLDADGVIMGLYGKVGNRYIRLTIDHIVPMASGGGNNNNWQVLCQDCNSAKGHGSLTKTKIQKIKSDRKAYAI